MKIVLKKYSMVIRWLIALFSILYICFYFYRNRADLQRLLSLDLRLLSGMIIFFVIGHFIYGYRFFLVLRENSRYLISYWETLRTVVINRFLCIFAPQSGNIYQGIYLKKKFNISITHFLSSVFSINWFDTCLNLFLALGIIGIFRPDLELAQMPAIALLTLLIILLVGVPVIIEFVLRRMTFQNSILKWIHGRLSLLFTVVIQSLKNLPYIFKLLLSGILSFLNTVILFYLCFHAIHIQIDWPTVAFFHAILKLCNRIVITPGNVGVREIAFGIISEQMDIGMAEGMLISLIMRCLGTLIICILGVLFGGGDLLRTHQGNDIKANPELRGG